MIVNWGCCRLGRGGVVRERCAAQRTGGLREVNNLMNFRSILPTDRFVECGGGCGGGPSIVDAATVYTVQSSPVVVVGCLDLLPRVAVVVVV